jgi:NitT/TauT family transport system substrate-binding protein
MIRLRVAACIVVAALGLPASAQDRVAIATQRLTDNGALFLAASEGYFRAEGIELGMTAYDSDQAAVESLAAGTTDFALVGFTPAAFNFAGKGVIKAIAAQTREKRFYENTEVVASNVGFAKGLQKFEDLANKTVAVESKSLIPLYQLEQIARVKKFDVKSVTVKPMPSLDALARAVGTNEVDAAIMPAAYVRELLSANRAKLVGWYSELDDLQFGALFVSTKMIATKRAVVEKFVKAYRRGVADYAAALLRKDIHSKRASDIQSHEAATKIARYVYPDRGNGGAATVEASANFIEPQAQLDPADIERQVAWYKGRGLVDKNVNARDVLDPSFVK